MTRFKVALAAIGIGGALALAGCASNKSAEPAPAASTAAPAAAAAVVPRVEITANSLNVRATASPTGAVLGSVKRGELVNAPQPASGGWQYVETSSGIRGYVASQYTRPAAGAAAAPAAAAPAAAPAAAAQPAPVKGTPPPPGSALSRITKGMTEQQVQEILGPPTSQNSYFSGKVFIPWGTEGGRMEYRYKGVGIVTFSRNRYSGGVKVVQVTSNPAETGFK